MRVAAARGRRLAAGRGGQFGLIRLLISGGWCVCQAARQIAICAGAGGDGVGTMRTSPAEITARETVAACNSIVNLSASRSLRRRILFGGGAAAFRRRFPAAQTILSLDSSSSSSSLCCGSLK